MSVTFVDFVDQLYSRLEHSRDKISLEDIAASPVLRGYFEGLEEAIKILEDVEYEWNAMQEGQQR